MNTVKRGVHWVFTILVAVALTFGATQAFASTDVQFCPGSCPPLEGGVNGSCWQYCEGFTGYVGGDCHKSGLCCCFE